MPKAPAGAVVGLTGATGYLGGLLLGRLLGDPDIAEVRSVARRALPLPAGAAPPGKLVHIRSDVRDAAARRALQGVDLLYHLAARVWQDTGGRAQPEMQAVNLDGALNVIAAAPGALVLASSAAVYGSWPDNPLPLSEDGDARPNPECPYAHQKLLAEQACARAAGRWSVVRLAAVLGAHADARVARAVRGYRIAVPAVRGCPQAVQWLDEDDAVEGLLAAGRDLLSAGRAAGQVVNVATRDWLAAEDTARLAHSRVVAVPGPVLIWASELGRRWRLTPFGADRAALIRGPLALSVAKADRLLGWRPARTSAQVLGDALERDWRRSPRRRPL